MTKLKENKVLIIGTIIFIVLLIFFLSIRCEKINIGSNKLEKSYIRIYKTNKIELLTQYTDIKFITQDEEEYSLKEALNKKIISIEDILTKSSKQMLLKDGTKIYYYDDQSKIKTNTKFEIIICNNKMYLIDKYENNLCLKLIN